MITDFEFRAEEDRFALFLEYYYSINGNGNGNGSEETTQETKKPQLNSNSNFSKITIREWSWTERKWIEFEVEIPRQEKEVRFGYDCYHDGSYWKFWWEGMKAKQFVLERKKYREKLKQRQEQRQGDSRRKHQQDFQQDLQLQ